MPPLSDDSLSDGPLRHRASRQSGQPCEEAAAPAAKRSTPISLSRLLFLALVGLLVAGPVLGLIYVDAVGDYQEQKRRESTMLAAAASPPGPESFRPVPVVSRKPPITDVSVSSAAKADEVIDDDELILGVAVNGESRAYPLNMLNGPTREIVNDTLGGRPIAATW